MFHDVQVGFQTWFLDFQLLCFMLMPLDEISIDRSDGPFFNTCHHLLMNSVYLLKAHCNASIAATSTACLAGAIFGQLTFGFLSLWVMGIRFYVIRGITFMVGLVQTCSGCWSLRIFFTCLQFSSPKHGKRVSRGYVGDWLGRGPAFLWIKHHKTFKGHALCSSNAWSAPCTKDIGNRSRCR